jgi:uncharacterized repeat protein (TIGR03803 family)
MRARKLSLTPSRLTLASAVWIAVLALATGAFATGPEETPIHQFKGGTDGAQPEGNLVADASGSLYGTTTQGGGSPNCQYGCGTVFQLKPPTKAGGNWAETILYAFQNAADGYGPGGSLVFDSQGNLYGISWAAYGFQIFQLSPPSGGNGPWTLNVLSNPSGGGQATGMTIDPVGNLYVEFDATVQGSPNGGVFELSPPPVSGGAWIYSLLYSFRGVAYADGRLPSGGMTFDKGGNLYGTTSAGGDANCLYSYGEGCGVVFKLAPPSSTDGSWTETVLHRFTNTDGDGAGPSGGVTIRGDNLYGTTSGGGTDYGTVFELSPPTRQGEDWSETIISDLNSMAGGPEVGVVFDATGNIYGVTWLDWGAAFELSPPTKQGDPWTYTLLYQFFSFPSDGYDPQSPLIFDRGAPLFGVTAMGGGPGLGVVYEVIP